ncbi:MAG: hypothetical protein JXA33_06160 [Anaerolineae bacterium]|nr:hypothetical protein [Anaerolineae bacterium]
MKLIEKLKTALLGTNNGEIRDPDGIYFYVRCSKCGAPVRVRADRHHDLEHNFENGGYVWHKEIMDGACFSLMYATVHFDEAQRVMEQEIAGGEFITWEIYQTLIQSA